MKEISLHVLDIVQNSIAAKASEVKILITENIEENIFKLEIIDDGSGLKEEEVESVLDPFVTSRETREVGLGLPFLKKAAEDCNGSFTINSQKGKGTEIEAIFEYNHIDRAPLGDITSTIISLISLNTEIDFFYEHICDENKFVFNTREIKKEITGLKINHPEIINWIEEYIKENLSEIRQ